MEKLKQKKQNIITAILALSVIILLFVSVIQSAKVNYYECKISRMEIYQEYTNKVIEAQNYELGLRPVYCPNVRNCKSCKNKMK